MKAAKEKRYHRAYKATDAVYESAMRKAKKDGVKIAQLIEFVLDLYGNGGRIQVLSKKKEVIFDVVEDLRNAHAEP